MAVTFRLTTPNMRGATQLQRDVNREFQHWSVALRIDEDDEYGPNTKHGVKLVGYGLGLPHIADVLDHQGCTPELQAALRNPHDYLLQHPDVLQRYHARNSWRKRLAHRFDGHGAQLAVQYALKMSKLGIVEHPPGSNMGPYITDWERLTGYRPPPGVFWCGCFVNACLVAGGFPAQSFLGYVPSIEQHAHAGIDGWSWHDEPHAGDVACFGSGEHTEFVVQSGQPLRTVGGNTSAGTGSPNNGGGVYYHDFSHYSGLRLDGYARPPWQHLN